MPGPVLSPALVLGQQALRFKPGRVDNPAHRRCERPPQAAAGTRPHSHHQRAERPHPQRRSGDVGRETGLDRREDQVATVIDANIGKPSPSHAAQIMIYHYAVPKDPEPIPRDGDTETGRLP